MHGAREPAYVALAGLLLFVGSFVLRPVDAPVGEAVAGARGLFLVAGGFGFLGGPDFLAPLTLVLMIVLSGFRRWWGAARVGFVMLATDGATRLLKLAFARPRPEYMLVETGGFSFPSGHASAGAAVAVLLAWFATRHLRGRWLLVAALAAAAVWTAFMALSRMVLGVHYLSDVVAGVGVGMLVGGSLLSASVLVERRVSGRA